MPVFGRDHELATIQWLLDGPHNGLGRILILQGEAGIGKTHLVGATRRHPRAAGMRVVAGGADELEQDRPGRILLALAKDLEGHAGAGPVGNDATGSTSGLALIDAVGDAIEIEALHTPVVVVVEDLQWADELSLRGIALLARRLGPLPVAMVATLRLSPRPPLLDRTLAALAELAVRRLLLSGVDDPAVASIVTALAGAPPGPKLTARLAGAAGNPLYISELVRGLHDDGRLTVCDGVIEIDGAGDDSMPPTLRQTLISRLSSLPPTSLDALRLASLLGREFTLSDLATISGHTVVEVAAVLRAPVDAAILSGDSETLSFRHDLVREAVYEDIVPAIRRDLHAAAGRLLAASDAPPIQVARQYALGARPGDLEAADWLERTAYTLTTLDVAAAVSLFEQSLALAGEKWDGRARVESALLEPLAASGRVADARRLAGSMLDRGLDPATEFDVRRRMAVVTTYTGDLRSAAAETEAAAALPGAPETAVVLLECLAASMALLVGRAATDVSAAAERALSHARTAEGPVGAELACVAHQTLALTAGVEGRYRDAAEHAVASRRLLHAHDVPIQGFLIPDIWEGTFQLYNDRPDEALASWAAAQDRAQRRGAMSVLVQTHSAIGLTHFLTGRWDDAVCEVETALAVAHDSGNQAHVVGGHAVLARIAMSRGDLRTADSHLADAHSLLAKTGHLIGVELLFWTQACAVEAAGDIEGALAILTETWRQIGTLRGLVQYRSTGADLVRVACTNGDLTLAAAATQDMEELAAHADTPSATAAAWRARGQVDNDPDMMLKAVSASRDSPRRIDHADTCESAARCLFAHGRPTEAAPLVDEAAEIHLSCGAIASLARVDALLRANGVRRRRRGPAAATHGWESLSPTERTVVDLVALGLSSPQIATRMFISRRTVETHLAHVFRKLDLSSRAQLAAVATARSSGQSAEPGK